MDLKPLISLLDTTAKDKYTSKLTGNDTVKIQLHLPELYIPIIESLKILIVLSGQIYVCCHCVARFAVSSAEDFSAAFSGKQPKVPGKSVPLEPGISSTFKRPLSSPPDSSTEHPRKNICRTGNMLPSAQTQVQEPSSLEEMMRQMLDEQREARIEMRDIGRRVDALAASLTERMDAIDKVQAESQARIEEHTQEINRLKTVINTMEENAMYYTDMCEIRFSTLPDLPDMRDTDKVSAILGVLNAMSPFRARRISAQMDTSFID
ncbi:unnamed protein product [Trichogramma brassicae]|uniref:Uncharacterized protein n=1 Tax=Trichogramma brassicae TaxID=86971 RepID=A0A6H5J241_9HYME|nr:unnamed protein product [Trichogramma brassicae]